MDKREMYNQHKLPKAVDTGNTCVCVGVPEAKIKDAIADGADSFEAVKSCTGAGGGCSLCEPIIEDLIAG